VISLPAVDKVVRLLDRALPGDAGYTVARWKNVLLSMAFYNFSRRFPEQAKRLIVAGARRQLGSRSAVDPHFTPRYKPWDQRLCVAPDGDLFRAIRRGKADVVTDHIETFTEKGIALRSGKELEADLVVTATGLRLRLLGGATLSVDGRPVEPGKTLLYKGTLLRDVPNFALVVGYTNASWTLKCDLACEYVCRILNHMDARGARVCVPRLTDDEMHDEPLINFSSGYIQRSLADLPRQGSKAPWRLYQNYVLDLLGLRYGKLEDGVLELR
jgi:monooxygenase